MKKYKYFIFDLDGVIIDSKKNMELSWKDTSKKFNLKIPFRYYFKLIGIPFNNILKRLKIVKKKIDIFLYYKKKSFQYSNKIKLFKDVKKTIFKLEKKKIKYFIVTSKDKIRSKFIIRKFRLKPQKLYCPEKGKPGKPHPFLLNKCIKKNKISTKHVCYVGDTYFDFKTAKRAGVDFIFAKYGYGTIEKNMFSINNFREILNYI